MSTRNLAKQATDYLESTKGTWTKIADETKLNIEWIYRFAQGRINDPGVNKIEKLLEHRDSNASHQIANSVHP